MSKKSKILTVAVVGVIVLIIWKYWSGQWDLAQVIPNTQSPHDLVKHANGAYYPRGESAQTIAERSARNSLPVAGRIYAPGSTIKLDKDWQGVACFDVTKRIIANITSDVWVEFRADQRDETIVKLPPSNWTEPTTVKVPPGNISEWRIMQDQNGSATAVTSLANKQ